jgi:hypothetical protein
VAAKKRVLQFWGASGSTTQEIECDDLQRMKFIMKFSVSQDVEVDADIKVNGGLAYRARKASLCGMFLTRGQTYASAPAHLVQTKRHFRTLRGCP